MSVSSRRPALFTKKPVAQICVRSDNIHLFLPPLPLLELSETQLRVGICQRLVSRDHVILQRLTSG
jgi:hypothetical protein